MAIVIDEYDRLNNKWLIAILYNDTKYFDHILFFIKEEKWKTSA